MSDTNNDGAAPKEPATPAPTPAPAGQAVAPQPAAPVVVAPSPANTELSTLQAAAVEVQRVRVHRQQREPSVIGFADGAARAVFVDIANDEVFVVATEGLPIALRAHLFDVLHHGCTPVGGGIAYTGKCTDI